MISKILINVMRYLNCAAAQRTFESNLFIRQAQPMTAIRLLVYIDPKYLDQAAALIRM